MSDEELARLVAARKYYKELEEEKAPVGFGVELLILFRNHWPLKQVKDQAEQDSTRCCTPDTQAESQKDTPVNVCSVYVSVNTKNSLKNSRLFRLEDHCTKEAFSKQTFERFTKASSVVDIKFTWWRDDWFRFNLAKQADFEVLLDIAKPYQGASGKHLMQVELQKVFQY